MMFVCSDAEKKGMKNDFCMFGCREKMVMKKIYISLNKFTFLVFRSLESKRKKT